MVSRESTDKIENLLKVTEVIKYLEIIRESDIPDAYLAGGTVRTTIWRGLFPDRCASDISDIDVTYFSKDIPLSQDEHFKEELERVHPTGKWEVNNQAWVHLFEPREKYWHPHAPYNSLEESMKDFSFTVNAIGVKLNDKNKLEIMAPFGVEDLLSGILRLTPTAKANPYPWIEDYISKITAKFPTLEVIR